MKILPIVFTAFIAALSLLGTSCSKKSAGSGSGHGHHHHTGLHGGTLIELGDHQYNLEWVRDAAAGTLTAYVLDAHAENFVRISLPTIALTVTVDGQARPLVLTATASAATGETVGNTSQFVVQAEWLKTTDKFSAVIAELEIRGTKFSNVAFNFPKGADHDHH
jgi:hypothetical protein